MVRFSKTVLHLHGEVLYARIPQDPGYTRHLAAADVFLCIGTSLQVYPANSLIFATPRRGRRIIVNPEIPDMVSDELYECIAESACNGVPTLVASLLPIAARVDFGHGLPLMLGLATAA